MKFGEIQGQTHYGAIQMDENVMRSLVAQGAGEFLRFEPLGDGSFSACTRVPETGLLPPDENGNEREIRLRLNVNRYMRGLARGCLDENGNYDLDLAEEHLGRIGSAVMTAQPNPNTVGRLFGLEGAELDDFMRFIQNCKDVTGNLFFAAQVESGKFRMLQEAAVHLQDPDRAERRADTERLLAENYLDYANTVRNYREMAEMDPEKEERILFTLDCMSSASTNAALQGYVNRRRVRDGLAPVAGKATTLDLNANSKAQDPKKNLMHAFEEHACFTIPVLLPGEKEPKVLSLETTAPPFGKILGNRNETRTGIGVFASENALLRYHADKNLISVPLRMTFEAVADGAGKAPVYYTKADPNLLFRLADPERLEETAQLAGVTPEEANRLRAEPNPGWSHPNETSYGGTVVTDDVKKQLVKQGVDDLLNLERVPDGWKLSEKMPEMGILSGREVHLRECVNYIIKGAARTVADEDGDLQLQQGMERLLQVEDVYKHPQSLQAFLDLAEVPEERREEVTLLLRHPAIPNMLQVTLWSAVGKLQAYQSSLQHLDDPENAPTRAARERYLTESAGDAQRLANDFVSMARMDPASETRFLLPADCGYSASIMRDLNGLANEYRKAHKLPVVEAERHPISLAPKVNHVDPNEPDEMDEPAFSDHASFGIRVKLNGKRKLLSLETTAAPAGKLILRDPRGVTGSGIYDGDEAFFTFHHDRNVVHNRDRRALRALESVPEERLAEQTVWKNSGPFYEEAAFRTRETGHSYASLSARLRSSAVDSSWIRSSREFRAMRAEFERAEGLTGLERTKANAKLRSFAAAYLKKKEASFKNDDRPNAYENARMQFARDVMEYTCAQLNAEAGGDFRANGVTHGCVVHYLSADASEVVSGDEMRRNYVQELRQAASLLPPAGANPALEELRGALAENYKALRDVPAEAVDRDAVRAPLYGLRAMADNYLRALPPRPDARERDGILFALQLRQTADMARRGVADPQNLLREKLAGKLLRNLTVRFLNDPDPGRQKLGRALLDPDSDAYANRLKACMLDKTLNKLCADNKPEMLRVWVTSGDGAFMGAYDRMRAKVEPAEAVRRAPGRGEAEAPGLKK